MGLRNASRCALNMHNVKTVGQIYGHSRRKLCETSKLQTESRVRELNVPFRFFVRTRCTASCVGSAYDY